MGGIERRAGDEGQKPWPMERIGHALGGRINLLTSEEFGEGFEVFGSGVDLALFPARHVIVVGGGVQVTTLSDVHHGYVGRDEVSFIAGQGRGQKTLIINRNGRIEILPEAISGREGRIEGDPVLRDHEGEGAKPGIVDAKFTIMTYNGDTQVVQAIGKRHKLERLKNGDHVGLRGRVVRIREPDGKEIDEFFARIIDLKFVF